MKPENHCECSDTSDSPSPHLGGDCRCTTGLAIYSRNGQPLTLCVNCVIPGDVRISEENTE